MRLSPDQLKQYHDDGFLIVRDVFNRQELGPLQEEINQQVDELAQGLFKAGKITNLHEGKDFYHRLTALERDFPGAAVLIHIGGVLRPQLAALWSSAKLLDMIEQLLGSEIAGHPVWNLRSKTPTNSLATVPWHQDTAYLSEGCEHTFQPTAWIPLIDADAENGTLQVIRGGHRLSKVLPHHLENRKGNKASWYLYIDEADLPPGDVVTCNMPMGSVLLLNQLLPHRSTENHSSRVRWSVDLRWQRPAEKHGLEGVKDPILMRTAANPDYKIDWAGWAERGRRPEMKDKFDSLVSGPWMDRWSSSDLSSQKAHQN
jgi:ectoine hydroxylase-related dioxygenase (phytanoyl-CoA dioxygenase family)